MLDNEKKLLYAIYRVEEGENMIYPSIDKLLNNVGSKFLLVNIVSKRAKEMNDTDYYQLSEYKSSKNIGKALEEISKGLVNIKEK